MSTLPVLGLYVRRPGISLCILTDKHHICIHIQSWCGHTSGPHNSLTCKPLVLLSQWPYCVCLCMHTIEVFNIRREAGRVGEGEGGR